MVLRGEAQKNTFLKPKTLKYTKNKNTKTILKKKQKPALLTRTCPPGLALAGPDMSEVRVLVQFCTFRVQKELTF